MVGAPALPILAGVASQLLRRLAPRLMVLMKWICELNEAMICQ
jgi:hypothetical protein